MCPPLLLSLTRPQMLHKSPLHLSRLHGASTWACHLTQLTRSTLEHINCPSGPPWDNLVVKVELRKPFLQFALNFLSSIFFSDTLPLNQNSVSARPCLLIRRLSKMVSVSACIISWVVTCSSDFCGLLCYPGFFLRSETWNTGWMLESGGSSSLYATCPIFLGFIFLLIATEFCRYGCSCTKT